MPMKYWLDWLGEPKKKVNQQFLWPFCSAKITTYSSNGSHGLEHISTSWQFRGAISDNPTWKKPIPSTPWVEFVMIVWYLCKTSWYLNFPKQPLKSHMSKASFLHVWIDLDCTSIPFVGVQSSFKVRSGLGNHHPIQPSFHVAHVPETRAEDHLQQEQR